MTKGRAWTATEDQFLSDNPLINASEASKVLQRSEAAIYDRRHKLRKSGIPAPLVAGAGSPNVIGTRTLLARTCPDCGLLLDANWYRTYEPSGVYERTCKRCVRKRRSPKPPATDRAKRQTRPPPERFARLTLARAARHGEEWSEGDFEVLANPDMTLLEKALALGRTYRAVANKASSENCQSKIGLGDPLKVQWHIDNPNFERITANPKE